MVFGFWVRLILLILGVGYNWRSEEVDGGMNLFTFINFMKHCSGGG